MKMIFHHSIDSVFGGCLAEVSCDSNDERFVTSKHSLCFPCEDSEDEWFDKVFHRDKIVGFMD
jgi:hypothetical protein